jgi:hypothetical protein
LYYVQDVLYTPSALTLTLTFVLDEELTLRFLDVDSLARWRRGLDHLLVRLLAPGTDSDAKPSERVHSRTAMLIEHGAAEGQAPPTIDIARAASSLEEGALDGRLRSSKGAVSEGQLQKRQRMAAILQTAASALGFGFNVARSPTVASVKRDDKYVNAIEDDGEEQFLLVKRRRSEVQRVSSSTQTEDEEFPAFIARIRHATADSAVDEDGNVDLALQYASLMAAAASAEEAALPGKATPLPSYAGFGTPKTGPTTAGAHRSSNFPAGGGVPPSMPTNASLLTISVDVVDFDDLQLGKVLGVGSEGSVHAAWYLDTPVAVKQFNRMEDSLHELGMYLGVGSHDNVVALRALCQHEGAMYLVLEFCPR